MNYDAIIVPPDYKKINYLVNALDMREIDYQAIESTKILYSINNG